MGMGLLGLDVGFGFRLFEKLSTGQANVIILEFDLLVSLITFE
jgi:hypothetical protein